VVAATHCFQAVRAQELRYCGKRLLLPTAFGSQESSASTIAFVVSCLSRMDIHRCGRPCHNEGAAPARRPASRMCASLRMRRSMRAIRATLIEPVVDVVGISWGAGLPRSRTLTNGARVIRVRSSGTSAHSNRPTTLVPRTGPRFPLPPSLPRTVNVPRCPQSKLNFPLCAV
jgi:hypothetical protein